MATPFAVHFSRVGRALALFALGWLLWRGGALLLTAFRVRQQEALVGDSIRRLWPALSRGGARVARQPGAAGLLVFTDYECDACRRVQTVVDSLVSVDGIRVSYYHLPVDYSAAHAEAAARAAVCSEQQGAFVPMHYRLMHTDAWRRDTNWTTIAREVGVVDLNAFHHCLRDEATDQRLVADRRAAKSVSVRRTPTFVGPSGAIAGIVTREQLLILSRGGQSLRSASIGRSATTDRLGK